MRHVMVATDGSKGANRAVDVAAEVSRALSGDLLIATFWIRNLNTDSRALELVPAFQNEAG